MTLTFKCPLCLISYEIRARIPYIAVSTGIAGVSLPWDVVCDLEMLYYYLCPIHRNKLTGARQYFVRLTAAAEGDH